MKSILSLMLISSMFVGQVSAQKFFTRSGSITFFSSTPMEDIEATNNQVSCIVDLSSGQVAFNVLMKGFEFEKALMQEHFNEKYVHSDKFPKAKFKGNITSPDLGSLANDGEYKVTIEGELTIHGVTKTWKADGTITRKGDQFLMNSEFEIVIADFDIKIPGAVKKNISETVKTTIKADCKPYKK
jgi:hypothetical protein